MKDDIDQLSLLLLAAGITVAGKQGANKLLDVASNKERMAIFKEIARKTNVGYGRCDLSILTRSNVYIELNSANFIPVKEYMLNTKKYGWRRVFT